MATQNDRDDELERDLLPPEAFEDDEDENDYDESEEDSEGDTEDGDEESDADDENGQEASDGDEAEDAEESVTNKQQTTAAKNGDLVDGQGKVVAKAGVERRLYERAQKMTQVSQALKAENDHLREAVVQARYLEGLPKALELSGEETNSALKLMASFKRDPVKTMQAMLTQVRAAGHNIEVAPGVDMSAVQQMLDSRLQPLIGERQAVEQQQKAFVEAQQAAANFLTDYPDAAIHEDAIARVMKFEREEHGRTITPEAAYAKLLRWATANGFDWSRSLVEQQMERQQAASTGQAPRKNVQQQKPRHVRATASQQTVTNTPTVAKSSDDYATIVRNAMKDILGG